MTWRTELLITLRCFGMCMKSMSDLLDASWHCMGTYSSHSD